MVEALKSYAGRISAGFHTPGHFQGKAAPPVLRQWWGRAVFAADLTEVPGLDDLHAPSGVIRRAQELAAALAGAKETFFLTNGSTAGVLAMFLAALGPGERVILPRAVHRSVVAALVLSGAAPVFLPVRHLADFGIPLPPPAAAYTAALARYPDARALFALYPDYYGVAVDLRAVATTAHSRGLPLLVDAAHGVLFGRHPALPPGAIACGADAAVESVHKRAGALTQAAWLHLGSGRLSPPRVQQALQFVMTSSPSYLLLASLDAARRQLALSGERLCRRLLSLAAEARRALRRFEAVAVLAAAGEGYSLDPTRLVLNFGAAGLSGYEAARLLRRHGVVAEMADFANVVLLLSPGHGKQEIKALTRAVEAVLAQHPVARAGRGAGGARLFFPAPPPLRLSPREAWLAPAESVPLEAAVGRVSAAVVAPAPPGIPVLVPGEEVTEEVANYLEKLKEKGVPVHGMEEGVDRPALRVVG
nr:aminotransferase class I/II-fold pyridoxal phosphate-dependent enzyme [Thermodesulfitimonas autotrophica]